MCECGSAYVYVCVIVIVWLSVCQYGWVGGCVGVCQFVNVSVCQCVGL